MRRFIPFVLFLPGFLLAEPIVLVDAIPTGGIFLGASPIGLPFRDAEKVDRAEIGQGLSAAVTGLFSSAAQNGISYICLLTAPGDNPIEVFISPAKATLKLRRKSTSVMAVFYRGGTLAPAPILFTTGSPEPAKATVSVKFDKISVPPGVTTAGWVYFDLTRVQAEVVKAGGKTAFLRVEGAGTVSPVPIPGMKEPLMMFEGKTTFTATWYMDPRMEAHERDVQGKSTATVGNGVKAP
jgi:hypothetical protein